MDVAGYCESCDRWFACAYDELDSFVCAWCGQAPLRVKATAIAAESVPVAVAPEHRRPRV